MNRRRSVRTMVALVASGLAALVVTGAGATSAGAADGDDSDSSVLRVGVMSGIENPNIWALNSVSEWSAVTLQYDMLLKFSNDDLTAAPSLAEGCEHNDDYTEWTCTLKDGLKWSDGEPLTAEDIRFTYQLIKDKRFPYFRSYIPSGSEFAAPDDTTFVWTTPEPSTKPDIPPWIYIVPEHVWGQYADLDSKGLKAVETVPTVSSGPYQMTKAVPGQNWTFTRNPNYWGEEPAFDTIVYQQFTNVEAMVQALKNGDIDMADELEASLLPSLESEDNITVQKVTPDCWNNLAFNFGGQTADADPHPALQDLTVRKAIAMAIDKQAIVDKVYPGAGVPGETIVRPLSTYWHLDIPDDEVIPYDPEAANQMLDEAGYERNADGVRVDPKSGRPLELRMPTSNDTMGADASGKLIAGYLDQIGIKVDAQPTSAGRVYEYQQTGNFDMYIWYWCGDPDPDYQLSVFTSDQCTSPDDYGLSDGCWKDEKFDAMYLAQRNEVDQEKRRQIVLEAQQYVYDQIPAIPYVYPNSLQAYRNDLVTNLTPVPGEDGYILPNYSYEPLVTVRPADNAESSGSSSSGLPAWAWVAGGAVILLGIVLYVRRGGRTSDDEA
ncbi:MAG TPA: ABC transporter substrate-binding protein [Actinomycetes bacterium]|nr:ABC transporter substrate-binding protein [Actinomycetes bacterium]